MKITIEGKQIDLGDALRQRVEDRINDAVEKYFGDGIDGAVTFSRNGQMIRVDCAVHIGHDIFLKSQGSDSEAHGAFDLAAERIEKQLRRYKRRLKDHHSRQKQQGIANMMAQDYVLASDDAEIEEAETVETHPVIIAETTASVPSCTVSDAVMRLDLADQSALMFRNLGNDRLNVVYRRSDGHIGWIDPAQS